MSNEYEILPQLGIGRNFITITNSSSRVSTEQNLKNLFRSYRYLTPFVREDNSSIPGIQNFTTIQEFESRLFQAFYNISNNTSFGRARTIGIFYIPVVFGVKTGKKIKKYSIFDPILTNYKGMTVEGFFETVLDDLFKEFDDGTLEKKAKIEGLFLSYSSLRWVFPLEIFLLDLSLLTSLCVSYYFSFEEYQTAFSIISRLVRKIKEYNNLKNKEVIPIKLFCGIDNLGNYPLDIPPAIPLAFEIFAIYNFRNYSNFDEIIFENNEFLSIKYSNRKAFFGELWSKFAKSFNSIYIPPLTNFMIEMMNKPTIQFMWGFIRNTFKEFDSNWKGLSKQPTGPEGLAVQTDPRILMTLFKRKESETIQEFLHNYSDADLEKIIVNFLNETYGTGNKTKDLDLILEKIYDYLRNYRPELNFSDVISQTTQKIQNKALTVLVGRC